MSQKEQQSYSYTNDEHRAVQPGEYNNSNYYYSTPPTKQELEAPLLDKGNGDYTLPLYVPPGRNGRGGGDDNDGGSCVCTFVSTVAKLSVFHFFNAVLGITGGVWIQIVVDISIALLSLCCLGILLYPVVFFFVGVFAKLDVKLYNFISPPSERVYLDLQQDDNTFSFSWQSIAAAVYLCTIKIALGVLSSFVVAANVMLLVLSIALLINSDDNHYTLHIGSHSIDARRNLLVSMIACVCAFLANVVLMHFLAKLSRASTRFFCCEKSAMYRYVNAA